MLSVVLFCELKSINSVYILVLPEIVSKLKVEI